MNGRLTLGLVVPIQHYVGKPSTGMPLERVQLAETLGFSAVWLRDVPFDVPSFGDTGQIFDPFVQLGALSVVTKDIALGIASVVLPLRHPAHVAKAGASIDLLSGGRLLMGVASGDRPDEYPALNLSYEDRGQRFRDSVAYIRAMAASRPVLNNSYGRLRGEIDLLPKPHGQAIPLLVTGGSRQSPEWVARHADAWMTYPRSALAQGRVVDQFRASLLQEGQGPKPVMQSLYIDLVQDPDAGLVPIHLGYRCGVNALRSHLRELQVAGVNHVALNLRFNRGDIAATLDALAQALFPEFQHEERTS